MPRCKICKEKFKPKYFLQKSCLNPTCIIEWGKKVKEKQWKKEKKQIKESLKSNSDHVQELQKVFNEFIRLRDKDKPCISCGTTSNVQYCAGHFYHAGGYPELRFNEDNVHKQCNKNCNLHLSGNLLEYRPNLIAKIGEERFKRLESLKNVPRKYTIEELKGLKVYYREKIKQLKRTL